MADEGYKPPQAVQRAAARGLELRREHGRGGTATGVARARDLSNGKSVSLDTVRRMRAFFDRHEGNKDTPPEEGNGKIAWLLWGGDPGRRWAEGILKREEAKETKKSAPDDLDIRADVVKVDEGLGLVMGYAIICKEDGEPYYDLQGDHVPEDAMLEAALEFMLNSQVAKEQHRGEKAGTVVFAFPMTDEIAKAFDILTPRTGLMIAMKPDEGMLKKFQLGELTGFSIGGRRIKDEEVDDA